MGTVKKPDCALALAAGGRPLKTVCEVLGVARSDVAVKRVRAIAWQDGRCARMPDDTGLLDEIRMHGRGCRATATDVSGRCCGAAAR